MKIAIILGTRPEIVKMAPIIRECQKRGLDFFVLHTNQHYSKNLDKIFFDELDLPSVQYNLRIKSGTHAEETGKMLIGVEKVLMKERPSIVLVEGDTNTVLAGALAATKCRIKIGHVEAGLRSYSRKMPEEINRILVDHCSDLLFAPTRGAKEILLREGIPKQHIFITGNTIVDTLYQNVEIASQKSTILKKLHLQKKDYFLVTAHRQENVDTKERLNGILEGLRLIAEYFYSPIVYPIHPRARKMIRVHRLHIPKQVTVIDPVGYLDFVQLLNNARLVLTDSGGVQEESCILKIPCVTLRDNTERPEAVEVGANILASTNPQLIIESVSNMLQKKKNWRNPFGSGKSAEKIVDIITHSIK